MTRKILVNWGTGERSGAFINFMKGASNFIFTNAADTPASLDDDGYPITSLSGAYGGLINLPSGFAPSSVVFVIKWPATRTARFTINVNVTSISNTFSFKSGGTNSALTIGGAGGRCEFFFNSYNSTGVSAFFSNGAFYAAGSGEMALVRLSDEASYDAGEYFTPEFLTIYGNLYPKIVRPMGIILGNSGVSNTTRYAHRTTPSGFSWCSGNFKNGVWGGTISGTDTYTMSAAPDSTSDWTDGEIIQGRLTNANTSTTPTLQIASRTAKTIGNLAGNALTVGALAANTNPVFVYDEILNKVLFTDNFFTPCVPIEAQVQLANRISSSLWYTFPHMADDDFVGQTATYVRDNLDSDLSGYFEYGNETWNFFLTLTASWTFNRGQVLGFPNGSSRRDFGWYGLRVRQIMGIITPIWSGRLGLKRVMAFQAFGTITNNDRFRFQGLDLSTSLGYTGYNSFIGVDYSAAPNRPIDWCDVLSYAPYYQGGAIQQLGTSYSAGTSAARKASLQAMASAYASGDTAGALALLDSDVRTGGSSGTSSQTLIDLSTNVYPAWDAIASTYGKSVEDYEGGLSLLAPTTAQCTAMGVTIGGDASAASAHLTNLINDYKNGSYGYRITTDKFDQFFSQSHSASGAWLTMFGGGVWGLMPGDIFSTPFQTYQAIADYNANRRRVRLTTTA